MRNHILNKRKQRKVLEFLNGKEPGDLLNFLEENKIDIDARMPDGETIFTLAFKKNNPIAVALLSKGPDSDANAVNNNETYLISAIKQGRFGVVSLLLEKKDLKINVNIRDKFGKTALIHAVKQRTTETFYNALLPPPAKRSNILKLLLDRKNIDLNAVDKNGKTALMYAAEINDDMEKILLNRKDIAINAADKNGKTALMYIIKNKGRDIIKLVLGKKDIAINAADKKGKTALMYFIERRKEKVGRQIASMSSIFDFLDKGAKINARDKERKTVLIYAVENKDHDMITILLKRKNIAITAADKNGKTALMYAIEKINKGDQENRKTDEYLIGSLLDKGVKINARDKNGKSALMYAIENKDYDVVSLLLDRVNIDLNVVDKNGKSALMYAIESGNTSLACFILDKGVKINARDKNGKSALMYAIESGNPGLACFILDKGAKVNVRDKERKTALMYAIERGGVNLVNYILEKGAKVNLKNKIGETSLTYAIKSQRRDLERLLLNKNAKNGRTKVLNVSQPIQTIEMDNNQSHEVSKDTELDNATKEEIISNIRHPIQAIASENEQFSEVGPRVPEMGVVSTTAHPMIKKTELFNKLKAKIANSFIEPFSLPVVPKIEITKTCSDTKLHREESGRIDL